MTIAAELSPQQPRPGEEAELRRLLDACLSPEDVCQATEDLPLLIGDYCIAERQVRRDDRGHIVSHAALYTHRVDFHGLQLRIGVIGGVATDPSARGQGHARDIVLSLCDFAGSTGHDVVLLWPQVEGYYEKMGFVWAGEEVIIPIPKVNVPLRDGLCVREATDDDLPAMMELHDRSEGTPRRDRFIWNAQRSIPLCEFFVLEDQGVVIAYAVVGKGRDLTGCIHEIIGPELTIPDFAIALAAMSDREQTLLMLPPHHRTAPMLLESMGLEVHRGRFALMRLPDPARLWRKLGLPGVMPEELANDMERFAREVFGPLPGEALDRSLPLPLHLSGLDSM